MEHCELCGAGLVEEHPHLLDRKSRRIACSCNACSILFSGHQGGRFVCVPRRILRLAGDSITEEQWRALMLPINLAFIWRGREGDTSAIYPSPAGVMESQIALPPWKELFRRGSPLSGIEPEVEALLVNRLGAEPVCYLAPIDACYRLAGVIRTQWRGLSGGVEVKRAILAYFEDLDRRATVVHKADPDVAEASRA
jgi:hypothetical protein